MPRREHDNGLYLRTATMEGAGFGPIGVGALLLAAFFFSIGEMIVAAAAGVAGVAASAKALISYQSCEDESD